VHRLLRRLGVYRREHVSVARDFSIYSAVNIVSLVLLLGTGLVLRRYLGLTLAGIWTGLEVLPTYAAYAHLGVLNAAERELPFLLGARRDADFERLKHTLLWLSHALGALLAGGLVAAALLLRDRVERPFFVGLLVYAPLMWTQMLATYYVLLFRARQRFVDLSASQGVANLLKALSTVAGGYTFGLYGIFAGLLIASVIQVTLYRRGLRERFERRFDTSLVRPLLIDGLPMLLGAVAFETIRNTDRIVIGAALGFEALGVYSVTQLVCQGVYYLPNALSTVMYPRFQERFGRTGDVQALRRFVELPLHVLGDVLLAATIVLLLVLPPAIRAWFPAFAGTIPPLRVMLVGTYFLCLAPPAIQLLLTVHKQVPSLYIALPTAAFTVLAAYIGSGYGLIGVACGVALGCVIEFAAINVYAFSFLADGDTTFRELGLIVAAAAVCVGLVYLIGYAAGVLVLPLLWRAARRIRALQAPDPVDNASAGH
jgi:O-antigen/teichoic acid export membrane protein